MDGVNVEVAWFVLHRMGMGLLMMLCWIGLIVFEYHHPYCRLRCSFVLFRVR
jgi:hypothetical protein